MRWPLALPSDSSQGRSMPAKIGQHVLLVRPAQRADPQLGRFPLPRARGRVLVYHDRSGMAVFPCRQDCRPDEGMVSFGLSCHGQQTTSRRRGRGPPCGGLYWVVLTISQSARTPASTDGGLWPGHPRGGLVVKKISTPLGTLLPSRSHTALGAVLRAVNATSRRCALRREPRTS